MVDRNGAAAAVAVRAARVSLVVGVVVAAIKFAAWGLTGSAAVYSDALESTVNVAAAALLVWTTLVAARPADHDHPYGHGKAELFSAGIEGALIFAAALAIFVEAIGAWLRGPEIGRLDWGAGLLAVGAAANAALGSYLVRTGRRVGSAALVADGRHVWTDVWTTAGVLVGLLAVQVTGLVWLDPLVAIFVAVHVLIEGIRLVRGAVDGLMDRADPELLGQITDRLSEQRKPHWIDVHGLRAWRSGRDVHVDMHMVVPRFHDASRLHGVHDAVESALEATVGEGSVVVHFDPCRGLHCASCTMAPCPVRSAEWTTPKAWTPESVSIFEEDAPAQERAGP